MTEIPCTITRDVPEAGVKAGQNGLVYAHEGSWRHVKLIGEWGQTSDIVTLPADAVGETTCRVRRKRTASIPKDVCLTYPVRFVVAVKSQTGGVDYLYVEAMAHVTAEQLQKAITDAEARLLG